MGENTSSLSNMFSRYPGIGFYIYGLITFILILFTYTGYLKTSLLELSFYMTISVAIGSTLQLFSTISLSIKTWRVMREQSLINRLVTSNMGVFFYGYSILLLWPSILTYFLRDYGTYISLVQFGILSTIVGVCLHIVSSMLSTVRRNIVPLIFTVIIAVISSTILFYNVLTPFRIKPLASILTSLGYFMILITSYVSTFKITGNLFAGYVSMILVALSSVTATLVKNGDYVSIVFAATYVTLFNLIFHLREKSYTTPLIIATIVVQALISKAYILSIMLAVVIIVYEAIKKKNSTVLTYSSFFLSLGVFFYILLYSQNILKTAFKICNIYFIISLTLSACLSAIILLEENALESSKASSTSIPLFLGLLLFFKESYISLVYFAIILSSILATYILKSMRISKLSQDEVEVEIMLDKLLISTPIILLLITSIISW